MRKLFDISRTLVADLAPWPGDTPFELIPKWKMAEGATVNLGTIKSSVHNGTHADGNFHFDPNGTTIERMPLEAYVGRAVVVDLSRIFAAGLRREITATDLSPHESGIADARRVLLKTNCWADSTVFPDWIPVLAADAVAWLREKHVQMLGVDVPSVDPIDAKDLANHRALAAAKIAIIESLDLTNVDAGVYQFAGLPLKISGGDGAPLRAVLWRD